MHALPPGTPSAKTSIALLAAALIALPLTAAAQEAGPPAQQAAATDGDSDSDSAAATDTAAPDRDLELELGVGLLDGFSIGTGLFVADRVALDLQLGLFPFAAALPTMIGVVGVAGALFAPSVGVSYHQPLARHLWLPGAQLDLKLFARYRPMYLFGTVAFVGRGSALVPVSKSMGKSFPMGVGLTYTYWLTDSGHTGKASDYLDFGIFARIEAGPDVSFVDLQAEAGDGAVKKTSVLPYGALKAGIVF